MPHPVSTFEFKVCVSERVSPILPVSIGKTQVWLFFLATEIAGIPSSSPDDLPCGGLIVVVFFPKEQEIIRFRAVNLPLCYINSVLSSLLLYYWNKTQNKYVLGLFL